MKTFLLDNFLHFIYNNLRKTAIGAKTYQEAYNINNLSINKKLLNYKYNIVLLHTKKKVRQYDKSKKIWRHISL